MTFDPLLFGAIAFGVMIAVIVFSVVWDLKKNKKKYDAEMEEHIEKTFAEEAEIVSFHAEIVDMVCGSGMVGSYRLPKSVKTFLVIFKNGEGEILELSVPEVYYLELAVGQTGMLTLCEGNLDSFELDMTGHPSI